MRGQFYDLETKECAVRLVLDFRKDNPDASLSRGYRHVGSLTNIPPDTLRTWVTKHEVNMGDRRGIPDDMAADNKRLIKENAQLCQG